MIKAITKFAKSEDGAITVDWVVLTAGIVGLAIAVGLFIVPKVQEPTDKIGSFMASQEVKTSFN